MKSSIIERLDTALVEESADGLFRCNRAIFTDAGFFELEMKHLFEGNWVYRPQISISKSSLLRARP